MADVSTSVGEIAERYATALFELAQADGDDGLGAAASDLGEVKAMLAASDALVRLVRSPVISRGEQGAAVAALAEKAAFAPLTRKFLGLLARNRRLFALASIIEAFETRLAAHRGEVRAEVISARELTDTQREAIAAALKNVAGAAGREVRLSTTVDASLLGGLIVKLGSRMVDTSIRSRLQRLKLAMKGIG